MNCPKCGRDTGGMPFYSCVASDKSETPLTDARIIRFTSISNRQGLARKEYEGAEIEYIAPDFARQLELANNALRRELEEAKKWHEEMRRINQDFSAQVEQQAKEIERWKKNYFNVADAVCRESNDCEDLCNKARATRQSLTAYQACARKLEKLLMAYVIVIPDDETKKALAEFGNLERQHE